MGHLSPCLASAPGWPGPQEPSPWQAGAPSAGEAPRVGGTWPRAGGHYRRHLSP